VTPAVITLVVGMAVFGVVLVARAMEARSWARSLVAYRLRPPAGLKPEAVAAWLGSLSALTHAERFWRLLPHPPLVVEIVASSRGIAHYLLMPANLAGAVLASARAHLVGARLEAEPDYLQNRPEFRVAAEWRLTNHRRALSADRATAVAAGILASLQPLGRDELVVVQWILTGAGTPPPVRNSERQDAKPPWWLEGGDIPADADDLRAMRVKQREPLLLATGRLGIVADSAARAYSLFGRTFGTLRQLNAPGVRFVRRLLPVRLVAGRLTRIALPITAWPATVNSREAVGIVALPMGEVALPGVSLGVARQVPAPSGLSPVGSVLAMSNYPGSTQAIRLSREDRTRHVYAVGPTGVGKSTLLANLVIQDMQSGDGLALIDPKGDLVVSDVLTRVPEHRRDDVIVVDLSDTARPIGLNVLRTGNNEHDRELAADHVLAVLRSLWAQYWGPRTDGSCSAGCFGRW
jgi:hypothetical protein